MEEKKTVKISLSTVLLIISVIIIVVMAYFLFKLNNEKTTETGNVSDADTKISNLENTLNSLDEKTNNNSNNVNNSDNSTSNNNNVNYIEMTEENYKKYNTSPYSYRIQDMIQNKDGTITIKGRVYKETDFLSITKEQYQDLVNNKTVDILGYNMKVNKEEDPDNGGYDLLITSTGDKWMKFYVEKNSDGTGKLIYYTEMEMYVGTPFEPGEIGRYIGTDTYIQITLNEELKCTWGKSTITLKQEYDSRKENNTLHTTNSHDTVFPLLNDEFVFKNGKCTSIVFSNV